MKKLILIYQKKYMLRPTLYKIATKSSIVLVLSLLWDRLLNRYSVFSMTQYAFFILGMFLMALSWFNYLTLDGVKIHHLNEQSKPKKSKHKARDIVDFVDEKIISFDELESEEQTACKLISNLLTGLIFILLSFLLPA